jgi:hypothetical protein
MSWETDNDAVLLFDIYEFLQEQGGLFDTIT